MSYDVNNNINVYISNGVAAKYGGISVAISGKGGESENEE